MRAWKNASVALKISIVATAILVVAVGWAVAAPLFDDASQDDAVTAREPSPDAASDDVKTASKVLDLGTAAKISPNYRIAVTDVSRYEVPNGQLVVPTIEATYIGTEDGEPWADLTVEFVAAGSKTFGESDCPAGIGHSDATDQPNLATDEEETYEVCIRVPGKDLKGGRIFVEEAFSTGKPIAWTTKGAVTKEALPSVAPESPATQAPAPATGYRPARPPANADRMKEACEDFDEDKYEDYKAWGEKLEDEYEANKDTLDDDKIDDYKEWKEDYDKMIDYYEKWDKACS